MDALTVSLKEKLFLQGEVSVDNEREYRHGGDMPLSQTDATLQSVANVDVSDLDGYDIPHEDMYEFDDDWMKDDPDYQKPAVPLREKRYLLDPVSQMLLKAAGHLILASGLVRPLQVNRYPLMTL